MISYVMAETQIIFRLDKKILKELDESLKISGFKTRNEWFRAVIRDFLGDIEREKVLRKLKKLEIKGLEDKDISEMIDKWRHEKK
jgi:metal-responsive CopG/Arc/MetJ family transcriptional regulator